MCFQRNQIDETDLVTLKAYDAHKLKKEIPNCFFDEDSDWPVKSDQIVMSPQKEYYQSLYSGIQCVYEVKVFELSEMI